MLKHVSFVTSNPDAVISFYERLGGRLSKDATAEDGLRRLVVEFPGGGKLQFFVGNDGSQPTSWMEHIAIRMADLNGTIDELQRSGVTFSRELHLSPSGNPIAFVLDPDGRHVELLGA